MTSLNTPPIEASRQAGHEVQDVGIRGILWLAAALTVATVLVMAGLWILLNRYSAVARRNDPVLSPLADTKQIPPPPWLQSTPIRDYEQFQAEQAEIANSYAWADRSQGTVRIPVERAIELYLQRAAPSSAGINRLPAPMLPTEPMHPAEPFPAPDRSGPKAGVRSDSDQEEQP